MTNSRRLILGSFLLAFVEAGVGLVFQLLIPLDLENQFFGGYSLFRLVLIFAFFCAFIVLAVCSWRAWHNPAWVERISQTFSSPHRVYRLLWIFVAVLSFFITILLIPPYRFGIWEIYAERSAPVFWWAALVSAQTFLALFFWRERTAEKHQVNVPRDVLLISGIVFLVLILILIWVAWTKTGVIAAVRPWYPVGVPLLPVQVWLTGSLVAASVAGSMLWRRSRFARRLALPGRAWNMDLLIGLGVWAVTAVLWSSASLPRSFFFPGPYPPNDVVYPYADSATWDMGGQFAFIGQGFANGDPFQDHVGWMGVLAFLHLLVGEDYARISALQAGLLAVFPALMYWLGKSFHSRLAGLFIAGLTIFHELNAFAASNMIDLSHARFLLTEYPTRVGLAALALLLFLWLRAPHKGEAYALPIGGLLAFMILVRFSMLAFPLAVVAGVMLVYRLQWKNTLRVSLTIFLALTITLSPWMWRSWILSGTPFFFAEKAQKIFNEKFRFIPPATPTPSSSLGSPLEMVWVDSDISLIRISSQSNSVNDSSILPAGDTQNLAKVILIHFVHNLVASTLILPTSLSFHDVRHTIYEAHPYWEKNNISWKGNLTPLEGTLLIINLALISIGLGVSWQKWKLASLVPLGVCLVCALSLAVARTSGGRYIVPMDWGLLFYWGIGITQAVLWGAARLGANIQEPLLSPEPAAFSYKRGWLSLLPFLVLVGAITVMDRVIPERYSELNKVQVFDLLNQSGVLQQADISKKELAAFIRTKGSLAYLGRGLYPRFYGIDQGEHSGGMDAYEPAKYPRLAFTLIGRFGRKDVVLPRVIQNPPKTQSARFPNASDVIVVGCSRSLREQKVKSRYIDALIIVLLGEKPVIYVRNPSAPLECPIPEPVCENNYSCQQLR